MHLSSSEKEFPKATVQQSLAASPSPGSNANTGSATRGSHNRTHPSRPPVTISGAPPKRIH